MIRVVTGPPFAGKSQAVAAARRPGDILLDTTLIWRAFRDPDEAERSDSDARIARAMLRRGLDVAVEEDRDGFLIVAERDPIKLQKWLTAAGAAKAWLVSAPMETLRQRARRRGPGCEELVEKWDGYEDDAELGAITEAWSEDEMRDLHEFEVQYRQACESVARRHEGQIVYEGGGMVQLRCLTDNAELRADMDKRTISGVIVRYGDEARIGYGRERIARGAFTLPSGPSNFTVQHDRAQPLGLMEYIDDEDAMRFRSVLGPGARQDQMLQDVASGLVRGASAEFVVAKAKPIEMGDDPLMEVREARLLRASAVDDGAYPQSKIQMAMEPKPAAERPGDHPRRRAIDDDPELRILPGDAPVARRPILMVA